MESKNTKQLAEIIRDIVIKEYKSAEYIYAQFKDNIDRKSKAVTPDLTDAEMEEKGLAMAQGVFAEVKKIKLDTVEKKLSKEIINEARKDTFDVETQKEYFQKSAKERVKDLISNLHRDSKWENKKESRKKNKTT